MTKAIQSHDKVFRLIFVETTEEITLFNPAMK